MIDEELASHLRRTGATIVEHFDIVSDSVVYRVRLGERAQEFRQSYAQITDKLSKLLMMTEIKRRLITIILNLEKEAGAGEKTV